MADGNGELPIRERLRDLETGQSNLTTIWAGVPSKVVELHLLAARTAAAVDALAEKVGALGSHVAALSGEIRHVLETPRTAPKKRKRKGAKR